MLSLGTILASMGVALSILSAAEFAIALRARAKPLLIRTLDPLDDDD
jgi:hypothetical protein